MTLRPAFQPRLLRRSNLVVGERLGLGRMRRGAIMGSTPASLIKNPGDTVTLWWKNIKNVGGTDTLGTLQIASSLVNKVAPPVTILPGQTVTLGVVFDMPLSMAPGSGLVVQVVVLDVSVVPALAVVGDYFTVTTPAAPVLPAPAAPTPGQLVADPAGLTIS